MQLYPDKPISHGVENALKRAKQMVELSWVPIRMIPSGYIFNTPTEKKYIDAWIPAHFPQRGVIYSSVRLHSKFVGSNVSLETYMTALDNPNSVLYTRPQHGLGRSMFSYYGIVCSAFASYVCQMPYPVACAGWPTQEGVSPVNTTELENLQLCDLVLSAGHIAVVTEILRDLDGKVHRISVSESVPPCCRCTAFTPEQFRGYWLEGGYKVYRYAGIHNVTYTPSPYIHLEDDPWLAVPPRNTVFMADYGNKANYKLGESVEFSIFEEGWDAVEITAAAGDVTTLPITGSTMVWTPSVPGYYTAVCRKEDAVSQSVELCVTEITIALKKDTFAVDEPVCADFAASIPGDQVYYIQINTHDLFYRFSRKLTPEEMVAQSASINYHLAPGRYVVTLVAENDFGRYTMHSDVFTVD